MASEYLGMKKYIVERESPLLESSISKQKVAKMSVHYDEKPKIFDSPTEVEVVKMEQEKFIPTPLMRRSYSEIGSFSGTQWLSIFLVNELIMS